MLLGMSRQTGPTASSAAQGNFTETCYQGLSHVSGKNETSFAGFHDIAFPLYLYILFPVISVARKCMKAGVNFSSSTAVA
jgi:hypothetical protein